MRPTKTKEKTSFKFPGEDQEAQPLTAPNQAAAPEIPGRKATTTPKINTRGVDMSQAPDMSRLAGIQDEAPVPEPPAVDDEEGTDGYPPDMLPSLINRQLARQGDLQFEPEWHQVRDLPGYMQNAIRGLGRQVFSTVTKTDLEDIQVLSTLTNDSKDVEMMAAILRKLGTRLTDAEMNFDEIMPGYKANVAVYQYGKGQFLAVKDFAGHYIYAWPAEDGNFHATDIHGSGNSKELAQGQRQLPEGNAAAIIQQMRERRSQKRLAHFDLK